jgi:hypothetical protein
MNAIDNLKYLKKHLKNQIDTAERLQSNWVYILKEEAEKCLELAEAEDTILDILNSKEGGRK